MSVNILLADDHLMVREGLKQVLAFYFAEGIPR